MSYKDIIKRAAALKGRHDHIGWRGICKRCGVDHNYIGEEIGRLFGDVRADLRRVPIRCKSTRCNGKVKILYKMGEERALHLQDIKRRQLYAAP